MTKPELGTKRFCSNCSSKFYDLHKSPIVCPNCHTVFEPPKAGSETRRPWQVPAAPVRQPEKTQAPPVTPDDTTDEDAAAAADTNEEDAAPAADTNEDDIGIDEDFEKE